MDTDWNNTSHVQKRRAVSARAIYGHVELRIVGYLPRRTEKWQFPALFRDLKCRVEPSVHLLVFIDERGGVEAEYRTYMWGSAEGNLGGRVEEVQLL